MIKIWPGMSLGDFLCQDVPNDWPDEEHYWQPLLWQRVGSCPKCGNPCLKVRGAKWAKKTACSKCPDGYDGGIP